MKKMMLILLIVAIAAGFFWYTGRTGEPKKTQENASATFAMEKDALISDMQIKLDQFREGIEDLKKQSAQKTGEGKEALDRKIGTLVDEWNAAKSQMDQITSAGTDQWQSIVESTTSAFDRLKNAYYAAKEELTK
ncbi:MAG: hypothetical protein Q7I97_07690 [Thermovirgaceae bacterium]|nr:hypothetical protein [Thermovirgaceae bacterium]